MTSSPRGHSLSHPRGYLTAGASKSETLAFIASMGWQLKSDPDLLNFEGEAIFNNGFIAARFNHGPALFDFSPPARTSDDNRSILFACVGGAVTLHAVTGTEHLQPFDMAVVQSEDFVGAESESSATCMVVSYRAAEEHKYSRMLAGRANKTYLRILQAVTYSLLQSPVEKLDLGFIQAQRGIEELAKATVIASRLLPDARDASLGTVHARGMALIRSKATDAHVSVESIARDLRVSRSYLFRAFKAHEVTPSYELRQARLDAAKHHLDGGASIAEAAALSGFGSARKLRRAFSSATQSERLR